MIDHITKITTTKRDGSDEYYFQVYYQDKNGRNGKRYTYSQKDNLPMSVVNFILEASNCDMLYTRTGKVERFTR